MKQSKRGLSLILAVLMLLSAIPAGGLVSQADDSPYQVGDVILFGSYPQRQVKSEAVIAKLEALEKDWQDYRRDTGMQYADFDYNGSRYRAVHIGNQYVNMFQQDNGFKLNTTYYFIYQPIHWMVLNPEQGLALCCDILDASPFANKSFHYETDDTSEEIGYASNYESSFIRDWLNRDFFQAAFTPLQQEQISDCFVPHSGVALTTNSTIDRVYLPTRQVMTEASYGFNTQETTGDAARSAAETDYAACMGLCCRMKGYNPYAYYAQYYNSYMLGTPFFSDSIYYVRGCTVYACSNVPCTTLLGVRPMTAFKLTEDFQETPSTKVDDYNFGDEIEFGSYPQTRVTDSALIASLNAVEKDWRDAGQYFGAQICDFDHEGERYRAIQFDKAFFIRLKTGIYTNFEAGTPYYYQFEPIKWIVMDPDEQLLFCAQAIDCRLFASTDGVAYADSLVRDYLNDEFYHTAFNGSEQTRIAPSEIVSYDPNGDLIPTTDYLYLPSYADVTSNADFYDAHRGATEYAQAQDHRVIYDYDYYHFFLRDSSCSKTVWSYAPHGDIHDMHQIPPEIPVYTPSYLCYQTTLGQPMYTKQTSQFQGIQPMMRLHKDFNQCAHSYESTVTREPTCTRIGVRTYCCLYCLDTYHEPIPRTDHDLKHYAVEKTCTEDGQSYDYCTMCKRVYNTVVDPSGGHQYADGVCTVCGEEQKWLFTEADGEITITGYTGSDAEVTVPNALMGKPVTAIGRFAFNGNENLTFVEIPDSVKTIDVRAFLNCLALEEAFIGDGLRTMENDVFYNCPRLATVCITSRNAELKQSFAGNDRRLTILAPITSNTANSAKARNLKCSTFYRGVGKNNRITIAFDGDTMMYQDLSYRYWQKLAEKYHDVSYFYFNKITFEGIYRDDIELEPGANIDETEQYLSLEGVCVGSRIKGEPLSFHELVECLNGRQSGLELFFVDRNDQEQSVSIRFEAWLRLILNVISRALNRLVSAFKKK